jgi:hypothetical protein
MKKSATVPAMEEKTGPTKIVGGKIAPMSTGRL